MNTLYNKKLIPFAKKLRRDMTEEERKLWYCFLNKAAKKFVRQKTLGSYIVDFYCSSARLVIEIDGSQHYKDEGIASDTARDKYLQEQGYTVLRYSNNEVNRNFEGVCLDINKHLMFDEG